MMKVPFMKDSHLQNRVTKALEDCVAPVGLRTRVQEDSGSKLRFSLTQSDPFPRERCGREKCPISRGEEGCGDKCYQAHVNYTIHCKRCEEARMSQDETEVEEANRTPLFVYYGESSRGCFVRFSEHVSKYKAHKNFMWDHVLAVHDGNIIDAETDFFMRHHRNDRDPLRRILRESIPIRRGKEEEENKKGLVVMNGKEEWFGVKVVKVEFKQD